MTRTPPAAALAAGLAAVLLAACGSAGVDAEAIPTTAPAGAKTICGGLPRHAVELATGKAGLRVRAVGDGLAKMRTSVGTSCVVDDKESGARLLDVGFLTAMQSDNQQMLQQFSDSGSGSKVSKLPSDLGTGLLDQPWTSKAPSAQVTMTDGEYRLQITLHRGPKERDQGKDVLAIARLLKPSFP